MLKFTGAFFILIVLSGCTDSREERFSSLNQQGIDQYARREYRKAIATWQAAHKLKPADATVLLSVGDASLKLAALPQAIETYMEAVRLFPERVEIRSELVRLLLISRDIGPAETQLQEVQKLAPDFPQTHILCGDLFLFKNQPDLAEKSYKMAAIHAELSDIALIKLAFSYLAQGRAEEAEKVYQQVAQLSPARVPVLLQMHYYWKFKDDFQKAEAFIQQALALEPENLSLRWEMAEFYFGEKRYDAAQACIQTILKETPENRPVAMFLVEILMARNNLQAAGILLGKLSRTEEATSGIALLQGKFDLLSNAPLAAIGCFKRAIDLDPTLAMAHYLLGLSYLADGRRHLARVSLTTALKIDPLFTDAELLLADLYYEQAEFELALIHAGRVADREKENYRAHLILGHIHLAQGQTDGAVTDYLAARKMHPDSIAALYYSAVAAENAQRQQTAGELYQKIMERYPGLMDVALRYCRLLIRRGETDSAVTYFEQAVAKDSGNGYLHYILGEAYLAAGQPAKAKQAFETTVRLTPHLISAYNQLEAFAEKALDTHPHIQLLTDCIENNPNDISAYTKLAQLYRRERRWEEAIQLLEKGLVRNTDSPWLKNSLAWSYLEQDQQIDKALELAQSAHELFPEAVSISDTLGWAYHKKGFFRQAVWILKDAAVKDPSNAMVAFHLGVAQQDSGESAEAEKNLKHALALKLQSPYRDRAETLLEKMNCSSEASSNALSKPPGANISTDDVAKVFNEMAPRMPGTDASTDDGNKALGKRVPGSTDIGLEDLTPEELKKK
jgi:tetratricopeptide (TPR) repeat protein